MTEQKHGLATALLTWFASHGRRDLPWQHPRSPYRVWLSEIMLQQTRVATVIPYFLRFVRRFPDIATLAAAQSDEVMSYWAGLGYYARARNLHAAAKQVVASHGGELPADLDALMALPGIGRSTAGAIRAQAFERRAAILDGNAKRVLARYHGLPGKPGQAAFERRLWQFAEHHTPNARVADYTQAIMDLGSQVCVRAAPLCVECPLACGCAALAAGTQASIPASSRRPRPLRHTRMLILRRAPDQILLQRRPPTGIWGGLWALPELSVDADAEQYCRERLGLAASSSRSLPSLRHGFTHFELDIQPLELHVAAGGAIMDDASCAWHARAQPPALPAPVARLIRNLS